MGTEKTKEILFNVLKCLLVFYAIYYVVASICFAGYKLESFDGRIPFDFKTWIDLNLCCTGFSKQQIVNLLSMEVTLTLSGMVYGFITCHWVWDYSITVIFIHIVICCIVVLDFPLSWSWWLCLGCGLLLQIVFGETIAYARRRKKLAKVTTFPANQPKSFLIKKV